jgi:hypothetical protein
MTRKLSSLYCASGEQAYRLRSFRRAAQLTFRAYHLNPTNEDADRCYRYALEKLNVKLPSGSTKQFGR